MPVSVQSHAAAFQFPCGVLRMFFPSLGGIPICRLINSPSLISFAPLTFQGIDAVCINQRSLEDKQQQIEFMGSIYENATTTYIWLGEGSPETHHTIQYLSRAGFLNYFFKANTFLGDDIKQRPFALLWSYQITRWSTRKAPFPYNLNRKSKFMIICSFR